MDPLTHLPPSAERAFDTEFLDRLNRPIQSDPGHHLRMGELLLPPANLPDALIRLPPDLLDVSRQRSLNCPCRRIRWQSTDAPMMEGIRDFSVDIELELH